MFQVFEYQSNAFHSLYHSPSFFLYSTFNLSQEIPNYHDFQHPAGRTAAGLGEGEGSRANFE